MGHIAATASSTYRCGRRTSWAFTIDGLAWVKAEYVGRAPLEGSDDRILAATFRQDEPAPAPSTVRLAATPIVPAVWTTTSPSAVTASVPRNTRYASASANDVPPQTAARPMSYAEPPPGMNGTDQFMNGRGLY